MGEKKTEDNVLNNDQLSMKELTITMERLEREYSELLSGVGLSYGQITKYLGDPSNFSPAIWQDLQIEKKKVDLKLDLALQHVRDPIKLKLKLTERGLVQPHWLFVR